MPQFIFMAIIYLVALILTFFSYLLNINGQSSLEISNRFPVIFAPLNASYVIWILIFILLGYWLVTNLKHYRTQGKMSIKQGILFGWICILQNITIVFWHLELFVASLITLFVLIIYLFILYNTYPLSNNKYSGRVPLSIYMAWSTFLFLTNVSFTLTFYEWNGLGLSKPLWAVILLTIGTGIALYIRYQYFDSAYPTVFIWAYLGIALNHGFDELLVTTSALFLCGALLVGIVFIKKNPVYQK